jgi:hypothetical protein
MYSLRRPRAFDELRAFQSIKHVTNYPAFIANKPCDLVGTSETSSVTVYENQYIPLTKE